MAKLLINPRHELWVSPVSSWEVLTLARKGRLKFDSSPQTWISTTLKGGPFREASFTHQVALAIAEVSIPHPDPIDAILAATARVYGLTLITSDHDLSRGTGFHVLKNE